MFKDGQMNTHLYINSFFRFSFSKYVIESFDRCMKKGDYYQKIVTLVIFAALLYSCAFLAHIRKITFPKKKQNI